MLLTAALCCCAVLLTLQVANAKQLTQAIEAGAARAKSVLSDPSTSTLFLTLNIESTNLQTQTVYKGRLTFVELPSSSAQAGASQFKGLEAARAVAAALGSEQASIPYRSHKLTMLLSDALGGNAKTTLWWVHGGQPAVAAWEQQGIAEDHRWHQRKGGSGGGRGGKWGGG